MSTNGKRWGKCSLPNNQETILRMVAARASLTAISEAIGTNRRHVRRWLSEQGVAAQFPYSRKGHECNQWKGGRIVDQDGYVLVYAPDHPDARKPEKRYVLEHRLVMERHLGRRLKSQEVVHHLNKNRADNRIENLRLFAKNADHLKHELTGHVPKWTPAGKRSIASHAKRQWQNWRKARKRS